MLRARIILVCLIVIASSCVYHDIPRPVNCELSGVGLTLESVTMTSDCSASDGAIVVDATGGMVPLTFILNNQLSQSTGIFQNIRAGIYSVRLRDAQGCETVIDNIAVLSQGLAFATDVQPDNLCNGNNGSITVNIQEGTGPYQYKFEDGEFSENNSFTALSFGEHTIAVKDMNDCIFELNVTVPRGTTGVSWSSEVLPIIETKCAIQDCHNGVSRPDLRIYQTAKFYANPIKTLTRERSMPFEGSLTQEQIDLLSCWVDDGAPAN